jgi:hypothetical protein
MDQKGAGALIDGGGAAHRAIRQPGEPFEAFDAIPLDRLAAVDLGRYEVVVVPRSCDGEMLALRRHQFSRFLDRGGVLIVLGEQWTDWVPGGRWEPEALEDIQPPQVAAHPLLDELSADGLWWHRGPANWCCHGHVVAPPGSEQIVTAGRGSWLYIDRVSTRGTILWASNLDLDTHAYHGSDTARTLLERVLRWAAGEARTHAKLRAARSDRIAAFFSGIHFQRGLFMGGAAGHFAVIPPAELSALELERYPAFWVPRESDQRTLLENASKLARYLEQGGRIICFEEIDRPWLPRVRWERREVDVQRLFRKPSGLNDALGALDPPWHAHGVLHLPNEADVLIADRDGAAVLATYTVGAGTVLAGTIDADSHAGYGSRLAAPFVNEVVRWSVRIPALR